MAVAKTQRNPKTNTKRKGRAPKKTALVAPISQSPDPVPEKAPAKKPAHPIFEECAQYTLDPYWQQLFEECSRGKFPRGSGIDATGTVVYFRGIGKNSVSYKLEKSPDIIFKDLKRMFQEQLGFKSRKDRKQISDNLDDICKNIQKTYQEDWNKIKRKKIKDPIIRNYILNLKEQYSLTNVETANVAQIIKLGFLFNWIQNEDVHYEDQRLLDIKTLHFDEEDRSFLLDEPPVQNKREYKPKTAKLSSLWEKYLEKPKNRYIL